MIEEMNSDEIKAHLAEVAKTCEHDQPFFVGVGDKWKTWCKLCGSELDQSLDSAGRTVYKQKVD